MRATSVPPDQASEASLDLDPARVVALRLILAVGGVEADHAAFAPEGLEGRFLIVDQGDHDLPVAGRVDLADQGEVSVENAFVDHRITRNLERIMFARTEQR